MTTDGDFEACMVFQGDEPHPAHRVFGDSIGCDYHPFEAGSPNAVTGFLPDRIVRGSRVLAGLSLPADVDVVVAEGSAPLQTALVYGAMRNPSATIIYLAADETFYTLTERRTRHLWRAIRPLTRRILDGVIGVSDHAIRWSEPYLDGAPATVVHPPIGDEKYDLLSDLDPSSRSDPFVVLSVGAARPNKNQTALVEAITKLRASEGARVRGVLIGAGNQSADYARREAIETPGFVSLAEFRRYFASASVYVQPSTADAYPVSSLEGMLSGTPTVVGENVGTCHRLPPEQVCQPTPRGIEMALRRLLDKSESTRERIGSEHREHVRQLTERRQSEHFEDAVEQLRGSAS